jgi:hypothetical protein
VTLPQGGRPLLGFALVELGSPAEVEAALGDDDVFVGLPLAQVLRSADDGG